MIFRDRIDAGQLLAKQLVRYRDEQPVVLALPRGGVPVALEIAKALKAPLDLILVRKIGAPYSPELAIGAIVDGGQAEKVINADIVRSLNVPESYIEEHAARELEEIERRRSLYLGDRPRIDIKDRTAIVVDDGIATGATVLAALRAARRAGPAKLVLAVPVAPTVTVERLKTECDELVCLDAEIDFGAISLFYVNFPQLDDDEVVALLRLAAETAEVPKTTAA
jgi:predicted phosphoribosyltransferase